MSQAPEFGGEGPTPAERSFDVDRLLTFVDAIVAIAITLLVLPLVDVAGEVGDEDGVATVISDHWPQIFGFLLSFAVIAFQWRAQHRVVRSVVLGDGRTWQLLMLWTLTIVFLPFPTGLVAQASDDAITKLLYIGTMGVSSLVLAALAWRIGRHPELHAGNPAPDPWDPLAEGVTFLVALAISLAIPATSYYPLLLLILTGRAQHRLAVRRSTRNSRSVS